MARLAEPNANLALNPGDRFGLLTKSHGHGAVHVVLHSSAEGLGSKWGKSGIKCVYFSQNTNGLVFRGLIPALGECSYIIFKYMLTVLYKSLMWPSSALCLLLLVHLVCRDCKLFNWYLPKDLHLLCPIVCYDSMYLCIAHVRIVTSGAGIQLLVYTLHNNDSWPTLCFHSLVNHKSLIKPCNQIISQSMFEFTVLKFLLRDSSHMQSMECSWYALPFLGNNNSKFAWQVTKAQIPE